MEVSHRGACHTEAGTPRHNVTGPDPQVSGPSHHEISLITAVMSSPEFA